MPCSKNIDTILAEFICNHVIGLTLLVLIKTDIVDVDFSLYGVRSVNSSGGRQIEIFFKVWVSLW